MNQYVYAQTHLWAESETLPPKDALQLTRSFGQYVDTEPEVLERSLPRSLPFVWPTGTIIYRPIGTQNTNYEKI